MSDERPPDAPTSARRGPPSILTPELSAEICRYVEAGNYQNVAAAMAGVSGRVVKKWLRRGRHERSGPYRDFWESVTRARIKGEVVCVAAIRTDKSWQARAWWLERRFPERWGRRRLEIAAVPRLPSPPMGSDAASGVVGEQLRMQEEEATQDEFARATERLIATMRNGGNVPPPPSVGPGNGMGG